MDRIISVVLVVVAVPAVLVGYILLIERIVARLPERRQAGARPWLWLAPALILLLAFLVLPTLTTAVASLFNKTGKSFIGLTNYVYFFTSGDTLVALRNSFIWLALLTAFVVVLGLITAVLFDRVRYEVVAKSLLFLPLAISFVGAGEAWIGVRGTGTAADAVERGGQVEKPGAGVEEELIQGLRGR